MFNQQGFVQRFIDQHPACIALILFASSRLLGLHILAFLILAVCLLIWKKQCWWGIILFTLGLYANHQDLIRNQYWNKLQASKGFSQMTIRWDEDVYLSGDDEQRSGWAWVWPSIDNGKDLKKRWWLKCKKSKDLQAKDLMLGATFQAKIFSDGNSRRSLTCVAPISDSIHYTWFHRIRNLIILRLESVWSKHQESERASLMRGMVTGNRDGLPPHVYAGFSRLGLLHLLALSGLHVGILFIFLSSLFSGFKEVSFKAGLCAFCIVIFYGLLGGWAYSLKRAVCMCGLSLWAGDLGRRYKLFNVLCFLALIEIILYPEIIYSLSFQLSYLGVLGIGWAWFIWKANWHKKPSRLRQGFQYLFDSYRTSWGAMLFTWPVVAYRFLVVPIWVWAFSIPLLILFSMVVIASFLGACCSLSGLSVPEIIWLPLEQYQALVSSIASRYAWVQAIDSINPYWMISYYLGLLGFVIYRILKLKQKDSNHGPFPSNA